MGRERPVPAFGYGYVVERRHVREDLHNALIGLGAAAHSALYRLSGGRFLTRAGGMNVLLLGTAGRKTGKRRRTMLTAPVQDGERIVLVGSFGGARNHPAWFLNLCERPDVEVTQHGRTRSMRARVASEAERSALWPRVVAAYGGYERYQDRAGAREIPLVILEP